MDFFPFIPSFGAELLMADWTQLPKELLGLISGRLETALNVTRFRSVCSSWRSSTTPKPHRFAGRFPIKGISAAPFGFYLSKRTVFLIGSPESHSETKPRAWIVKIEEDIPGRKHILNPLTRSRFDPLPQDFPRVLDLSQFRVCELGHEFVLHYLSNKFGDARSLYMEKVVVLCLDDDEGNDFVLLTIHVSGKLAIFKSGDKSWTIIHDMPSPYDDVMLFKGQFFAVDNNGRAVVVDALSSDLSVIANPVFGGDKKILVESGSELLLVDMYLSIEAEGGCSRFVEEYFENLACYLSERTVRFRVFRLDEERKMWIEVQSLGDLILFLGDDCTFSVSACDILSGCKGNRVLFADNFLNGDDDLVGSRGIGMFDIDSGNIGPLRKYPEYSKMFWPPPQWIISTTSEQAQDHVEELV